MTTYRIPESVTASNHSARLVLSTCEGGYIAIDAGLLSLWKFAGGRTLAEILEARSDVIAPDELRARLACLAEAGLLGREASALPGISREIRGDLVSVVIVAHNSLMWLEKCLPTITAQGYQPLEIIIVDNGSSDGTDEWIANCYPKVRYIPLETLQPFAAAVNAGVSGARGEYYFLLNPDTYLENDAVTELVQVAREHPDCGGVGAKLLHWWTPRFLNGLGNHVGAFSWGSDNGLGHLDLGQFDRWEEIPSACFAAALIPRQAWEEIGALDEGFPMYYEDSEWSYRARLMGKKVYAAPRSIVYHAFGGNAPQVREETLSPAKLRNVVYGRYRFVLKLLAGHRFLFLLRYFLEDLTNVFLALVSLRIGKIQAYFNGWLAVLRNLAELRSARVAVQKSRIIDDKELFELQKEIPGTLMWKGIPELTSDIIRHNYLPLLISGNTRPMPEFTLPKQRCRLLIVSQDVVDIKMAGPGMRYLEIGRTLSADMDVTLAAPSKTSISVQGMKLVRYQFDRPDILVELANQCNVVLISSFILEKFPFLEKTAARVVVDFYDPTVLENLQYYVHEPIAYQASLNAQVIEITNRLAQIGDFYLCGNERQRDYWMGVLTANGRTNPLNYRKDQSFRTLIDVVGIGFPGRGIHKRPYLKGLHPRFPLESRIVLWGGGIWDWLDPLSLIESWPAVLSQHPEARLVFLGTRHPNPEIPRHRMADRAEALAAEIGEKDQSIFFIEWLPYETREYLLGESDVGVVLHPEHAETRYAMRTRVMDYIWARLPLLVTEGDVTSEWVKQHGIGLVTKPNDSGSVAEQLCGLLDQPKEKWSPAFTPLIEGFSWEQVVEPLRRYCLEGTYAPDRHQREQPGIAKSDSRLRARWARAAYIIRSEGWRMLVHRTWRYFQWWFSKSI
jgi:GT2 family glycosyltransferase